MMQIRPILASILVTLSCSTARAECVTAADLDRGIRVTFDNGDTTTLQSMENGMIEVFEYLTWSELVGQFETYLGLYYVNEIYLDASGTPDPTTRSTTRYEVPANKLPIPHAELAPFDLEIVAREFTRSMIMETQSMVFGSADPLILGDCTYSAVAVGQRDRPGQADQRDKYFFYLPEIGIAFIVAWTNGSELTQTVPVAIEVMKD